MDSLRLHIPWAHGITLIPNCFLDEYMLKANGEFVKIYLYLLRSAPSGNLPSLSVLADKMYCTERDILRAIRYWEKEGLLLLASDDGQKLSDVTFTFPENHSKEKAAAAEPPKTTPTPEEPEPLKPQAVPAQAETAAALPPQDPLTPDQVKKLKEDEDIVQLLYIAEQYLARPLTVTDTNKILYFYEKLKFNTELIEYLVEYCVSKNHKSIRYIEKVALSWAQQGISTVEAAKETANQYSKTYFTIFKALGIQNRNPVKSEMEIMDRWLHEWGFSMDLILEACKRTVLQTGSASFPYTDKILEDWRAAKVHCLADLEAVDANHKAKASSPSSQKASHAKSAQAKPNRFNDYPHRDYDFDQIKKSMFQQ